MDYNYNLRLLRLPNRETTIDAMAEIGVSEFGQHYMLDKNFFYTFQVDDLSMPAVNILKQEMLSRGGEVAMSRMSIIHGAERSSAIISGTLRQYRELCEKLHKQQFALPRLADTIMETLDNLSIDHWSLPLPEGSLELGEETKIMGIVNVTPDSFSDGGRYRDTVAAVAHGEALVAAGAHILDIGGESTRPGYQPVSAEEEMERILPVIEALKKKVAVPISIDTQKAEVAAKAVVVGAAIINDISGFGDTNMAKVVADLGVPVVAMHCRPEGTAYEKGVISDIMLSFHQMMKTGMAAGIKKEQFILDPGVGFGKNGNQNTEIIRRLPEFATLGRPILMGASRKRFLGTILDKPPLERTWGDAAVTALSIANGAAIVRVHAVEEMVQVAKVADVICKGANI